MSASSLTSLPISHKVVHTSPPRWVRGDNWWRWRSQKYLYICAYSREWISTIEDFVTRIIPDIQEKVHILSYTDPDELASHAQRTLVTNVRSVVGICLWLTEKTVDSYFRVMCALMTEMFSKFATQKNDTYTDLRLALCALYTFWKRWDKFTLSSANDDAWNNFLDIRDFNDESSWDIRGRFREPFVQIDEEFCENYLKTLIRGRMDG